MPSPLTNDYLFLNSVLTVNYVVQDGKSNWLEGFILMGKSGGWRQVLPRVRGLSISDVVDDPGLYVILAVTFWYYPGAWLMYPLLLVVG